MLHRHIGRPHTTLSSTRGDPLPIWHRDHCTKRLVKQCDGRTNESDLERHLQVRFNRQDFHFQIERRIPQAFRRKPDCGIFAQGNARHALLPIRGLLARAHSDAQGLSSIATARYFRAVFGQRCAVQCDDVPMPRIGLAVYKSDGLHADTCCESLLAMQKSQSHGDALPRQGVVQVHARRRRADAPQHARGAVVVVPGGDEVTDLAASHDLERHLNDGLLVASSEKWVVGAEGQLLRLPDHHAPDGLVQATGDVAAADDEFEGRIQVHAIGSISVVELVSQGSTHARAIDSRVQQCKARHRRCPPRPRLKM
mmetsp:Transcript_87863/g.238059  ORF Transcript_87863/g.238059 Transcript_87863/m.238059 type:complete len:311 (-) Transcript_87863:177-1109(-)